jgi:hypothetical protein
MSTLGSGISGPMALYLYSCTYQTQAFMPVPLQDHRIEVLTVEYAAAIRGRHQRQRYMMSIFNQAMESTEHNGIVATLLLSDEKNIAAMMTSTMVTTTTASTTSIASYK